MTITEINNILGELNIMFPGFYDNTGTPWLECREIALIVLNTDDVIYPDDTMQVKFDTANSLLLTRSGYYEEDGVTFVSSGVRAAITMTEVGGIILQSPAGRKSPYKIGGTA
jgi:hypothetical protein